jgi:hypothetical protein
MAQSRSPVPCADSRATEFQTSPGGRVRLGRTNRRFVALAAAIALPDARSRRQHRQERRRGRDKLNFSDQSKCAKSLRHRGARQINPTGRLIEQDQKPILPAP